MTRPLIIPSRQWESDKPYLEPATPDVVLFQKNNRLTVDGIVGPQTLGACWRDRGEKSYTHLCWHERRAGGASSSAVFLIAELERQDIAPIAPPRMGVLARLLSSEWSTGLSYLSSQDGVTAGFRRYAGSKLRGLLLQMGIDTPRLPGPNNGAPLDDPEARIRFLNLARDPDWWRLQIAKWCADLDRHLEAHKMRDGRGIALYERASNSGAKWVAGCHSYADIKAKYIEHPRGPSRIRRLEDAISAGEIWR